MQPPARPPMKPLPTVLILITVLAGCQRPAPDDRLAGVPISAELRPLLEASRRSLEEGDRSAPGVRRDLDRYFELQELLDQPERRAAAEESLLSLWNANPAHVLWPELVCMNRDQFEHPDAIDRIHARPDFPESTTAVGALAREWRTYGTGTRGGGFHRAWARREELAPWEQARLAILLSWIERGAGRSDEATRFALDGLREARGMGSWRLQVEGWHQLTNALVLGDHLDDALHGAAMEETIARALLRENGNHYIVDRAEIARAEVLAARREYQPALRLFAACVDSALAHGLPFHASYCLNRAGILTAGSGDLELGLEHYRRAVAISRADGDSMIVPRHLANIARRHLLIGNLDSCRVYLREAERWIEAAPFPANRARFPLIQAEYYAQIGDFAKVDSLIDAAAGLGSNLSGIASRLELHLEQIKQGMERGRPEQAYRSIAVLDSLRDRMGTTYADRNEVFDLDLHSAEFLGRQGQFVRAEEALDRAERALERRPDPGRQWQLSRARGDLARRRGIATAADSAYSACHEISRERQDAGRVAESRVLLASVLLDQGRFEAARELLPSDEVEAFGGRFRTRLTSLLLGAMAESRAGRHDRALRELDRARALCRPASPPDLLARLDLETGRARAGLGRRADARESYARTAEHLARELGPATSGPGTVFDRDLRRDLALAMLDLALGASDRVRGEEAEAVLREVAAIIPEWRRDREPPTATLRTPQIVFLVGANGSYRWDAVEGEVSLRRLPGEEAILATLAPVLADLQHPGRVSVPVEMAALVTTLGGPPERWANEQRLTIVPDGSLFSIPWAALPVDGDVWIGRGPIALADAPSFGGSESGRERHASPRLLALGVDSSPQGRGAGLPALRHAEREAREVHALWPAGNAVLRVGDEAEWRALDAATWATFDVIHIASHALVHQGGPDRTTLLLAGSARAPVTSAEIGGLDLAAELVFLSCCEAAEGVRRGVGLAHAGLARSFLAAGARVVVAPSVRIDDEAARRLSAAFYRHWLGGENAASALRRAQRELRGSDARRAHPYYWAFYQAIGG